MYINHYREKLLDIAALKINISSAKGNKIILDDGRVICDFLAQYGALPFGHSPEFACEAMREFIDSQMPNFIQPNMHPKVKELASLLARHTSEEHYKYCTFTNSGTETVEAAIKLARITTGRNKILSLKNSFHGKTFSSLSATGSERFKAKTIYDPVNYEHVDFNNLVEISERLSSRDFAAFIIEPVQGEGGMVVIPPELLSQFIDICQKTGTVSIFDEIQTGLGRVGAFCTAKQLGLFPDILLFSKALGAGFIAVGAMLYAEKLHSDEFDQKHSSTFANNVLAATMGIAVIQQLTRDNNKAIKQVNMLSLHIDSHLEKIVERYPKIFSWQGTGLMRGLEFKDVCSESNILNNYFQRSGHLAYIICSYLLNRYQLLTMPLLSRQCSIRFEPPLDVSVEDVDTFFQAIEDICQLIHHGRYDVLLAQFAGVTWNALPPPEDCFPISTVQQIAQKKSLRQQKQQGKKFAFLIHNSPLLSDTMRTFCHAIRINYTQEQQVRLAKWFIDASTIEHAPELAYEFSVESDHACVDGMLIFSPISNVDMMKLSRREKQRLMRAYFDIANKNNAEIVGLGAYTSVITSGGETMVANPQKIILTNGNSLTALSVVMSVRAMLPENPSALTGCVIGSRGSVGRLCAIGLAHTLGKIILVGRSSTTILIQDFISALSETVKTTRDDILRGSVLDKFKSWLDSANLSIENKDEWIEKLIPFATELGIEADNDYPRALAHSDFIISATSEGKPFLSSRTLREGAVVFDTARPFDFIRDGDNRIFEGGLVYQPQNVIYSDSNIVEVPAGTHLACLSETIAIALEGMNEHQSIGKKMDYNHALNILNIAKKHGFLPVDYTSFGGGEK